MSFLDSVKKAHLIGVGGIGVSAVARLLKHHGVSVTGSNSGESEIVSDLLEEGFVVSTSHDADNLSDGTDLVVFSSAVPAENVERVAAREAGIREMDYFAFLGEYSKGKRTIAVSGTNGKSTTTAMLGLILERAGLDPTVIVGSKVPTFPLKNLRLGKSDLFVVEACEHEAHMLLLSPQTIVLTNIEADHLDFYRDLDHICETFQEYVNSLPESGLLISNADDAICANRVMPGSRNVTFGLDKMAEYRMESVSMNGGRQTFKVVHGDDSLEVSMPMPGRYNAMNAIAAATAALELGASKEDVSSALGEFTGIWRRFERIGSKDGIEVISDYAHHPTAVRGLIDAAREFFPGRRIVVAFQPHHHNRTKNLFDEFVASFDDADALVLADVYDVTGRGVKKDEEVNMQMMVNAIKERRAVEVVEHGGDAERTESRLREVMREGDVVLVAGAGDLYKIAARLVE